MKSLVINKKDLQYNIEQIKKHINKINHNEKEYKLIGVVKGNAYGLGLVEFSKILIKNDIKTLAVAKIDEAIKLRKAEIKVDILMLSQTKIKTEIEELIKNDIILTIGSKEAADNLIKIAKENKSKKIKIHIKIDSGFGRYGFLYKNINEIIDNIKKIKKLDNIEIEGIFSHFSIANYKKNRYTKKQFERFTKILEILKMNNINIKTKHICNSPAFLNYPSMHLNGARIGSAFLGRVNSQSKIKLKQIGQLKTNIIETKILPKDFYVSYLKLYKTKNETKIAIIQTGYGDGVNINIKNDMFRFIDKLRNLSQAIKRFFKKEKITVTINDKKYNVIGKTGMFHMIIDISKSDIKENDFVYLNINPIYINSEIRREYI